MTTINKQRREKFLRDLVKGIVFGLVIIMLGFVATTLTTACGLLTSERAKTALDAVRGPAGNVLTKVIRDRFDSGVDESTARCWEQPEGFTSGDEDMDDDERGAFISCWARASE